MPEFFPSARSAENPDSNSARAINCYREAAPFSGQTNYVLKSVLGTEAFADTATPQFRAIAEHRDNAYVAAGGTLFEINTAGMATNVGGVSLGDTSIAGNNAYVVIAANGKYYSLTGGTLTQPTVNQFADVGSLATADQYTVITEKDGRKFGWSDVADPTTQPALNFATAEGTEGNLLRVAWVNSRLVLFKEDSREVWYNTGRASDEAFLRVAGGVRNTGLKSYDLICHADDVLFYVGNDNICRLTADGLTDEKMSYPAVDKAIEAGTATEAFYYEDAGHKFCVVRFSDRPAWQLNLASREWTERAEGWPHDAWGVRGTVNLAGKWLAARDDGAVWCLTRNNADVNGALRRTAVSPTYYFRDRRVFPMLRIFVQSGQHDLGRDAQIMLRVSRDRGATWSLERWRSLGGQGDQGRFATWRGLGQARQMTIEATISEPAEMAINSVFDLP